MTTDTWAEVALCALLIVVFWIGWILGDQHGYARRQRDEEKR